MKAQFALLTLITLAGTALSACGQAPVGTFGQAPVGTLARPLQSFQATPLRRQATVGQLLHAGEMRGFSTIQNPMRTMHVEFSAADGQKMVMQADRFLKAPSFNISVGPEHNHAQTQYFVSTDKAKVQALFNTLQGLEAQAADANSQAALGRILDHLRSAL